MSVVVLAVGLSVAGCSQDAPNATDDPIDAFCLDIIDANAALRDLSDGTSPGPGLQAAGSQLGEMPLGPLRDQATKVLHRLEVVATDGVGPVSGEEQSDLRLAFSAVSSECTSRGYRVDLLEGFSAS